MHPGVLDGMHIATATKHRQLHDVSKMSNVHPDRGTKLSKVPQYCSRKHTYWKAALGPCQSRRLPTSDSSPRPEEQQARKLLTQEPWQAKGKQRVVDCLTLAWSSRPREAYATMTAKHPQKLPGCQPAHTLQLHEQPLPLKRNRGHLRQHLVSRE